MIKTPSIILFLLLAFSYSCSQFVDDYQGQTADLRVKSTAAYISTNATVSLNIESGVKPYKISLGSGQGTINSSEETFTAPATAGQAVVSITDAKNQSVSITYTIHLPLSISPGNVTLTNGNTQSFSASGGVGSVSLELASGLGNFNGGTGIYTPPAKQYGAATIRATDSIGNTSTSSITYQGVIIVYATTSSHNVTGYSTRSISDGLCSSSKTTRGLTCNHAHALVSYSASDQVKDFASLYGVPSSGALVGPTDSTITNSFQDLITPATALVNSFNAADVNLTGNSGRWYSGTIQDGSYAGFAGACNDFTSTSGAVIGKNGDADTTGSARLGSSGGGISCTASMQIPCICWQQN